jgi:cobalt/nickel transport protein
MVQPTPETPRTKQHNWPVTIAVIMLTVFPLIFVRGEYNGSDGQAQKVIKELNSTYQPWFKPFFTPPSKEIESLLFASQAALGAGVMGYVMGLYQGRAQQRSNEKSPK